MSVQTTIRLAVPSDLKAIRSMALKTITNSCKKEYSPEQLTAWKNALGQSDRLLTSILYEYFIVAIREEKIVGFGSIDQGTYLNYLYVSHQQKQSGVGSLIIKSLLQEALRLGKTEVTTHASLTAGPFFERIGFKQLERNTKTIDGVSLSHQLMKIVLK